jgi:hypothetical protein
MHMKGLRDSNAAMKNSTRGASRTVWSPREDKATTNSPPVSTNRVRPRASRGTASAVIGPSKSWTTIAQRYTPSTNPFASIFSTEMVAYQARLAAFSLIRQYDLQCHFDDCSALVKASSEFERNGQGMSVAQIRNMRDWYIKDFAFIYHSAWKQHASAIGSSYEILTTLFAYKFTPEESDTVTCLVLSACFGPLPSWICRQLHIPIPPKLLKLDCSCKSKVEESRVQADATRFECLVAHGLAKCGIRFKTEAEQRGEAGADTMCTPDFLLAEPIFVYGTLVYWVEVKNYFGDDSRLVWKGLRDQTSKYNEHFGPGIVAFRLGATAKLAKKLSRWAVCVQWVGASTKRLSIPAVHSSTSSPQEGLLDDIFSSKLVDRRTRDAAHRLIVSHDLYRPFDGYDALAQAAAISERTGRMSVAQIRDMRDWVMKEQVILNHMDWHRNITALGGLYELLVNVFTHTDSNTVACLIISALTGAPPGWICQRVSQEPIPYDMYKRDCSYITREEEVSRREGSFLLENKIACLLRARRISFITEADMLCDKPNGCAPDFLLTTPVTVCGKLTRWIDVKNSFGDGNRAVWNTLKNNARRCHEQFGPGIIAALRLISPKSWRGTPRVYSSTLKLHQR